jgi:hypothetical protein
MLKRSPSLLPRLPPHKDEFDAAEALINACRKSGDLPLDICGEDDKRIADNVEDIDPAPKKKAAGVFNYVQAAEEYYTPFSFWEDLDFYVQMGVEKSDIRKLFSPTCAPFCLPIANLGGWADLNVRAGFMRRFAENEAEGKQCVLLVFTDLDPGGLNISNFLRANLEELARAVGWSPNNLIIDRFGLDRDFVERHALRWIENLKTAKGEYPLDDEQHPDHEKKYVQDYLRECGARKVEANALLKVATLAKSLCRQAILKYLPAHAVRRYHAKLKPVRAEMRRELDRLLVRKR